MTKIGSPLNALNLSNSCVFLGINTCDIFSKLSLRKKKNYTAPFLQMYKIQLTWKISSWNLSFLFGFEPWQPVLKRIMQLLQPQSRSTLKIYLPIHKNKNNTMFTGGQGGEMDRKFPPSRITGLHAKIHCCKQVHIKRKKKLIKND